MELSPILTLNCRKQFSECKLRVFSLANRKDELDRETRNMAALLAKFRIDFSSVLVIPGELTRNDAIIWNNLSCYPLLRCDQASQ